MDDPTAVRALERLRHLAGELDGVRQRELPLSVEPRTQRLALDERHDVIEESGRFARVVQREDVGVLEVSSELDLTKEAVRADRCGELRPKHLDSYVPVVAGVAGQIHRGHSALTQ